MCSLANGSVGCRISERDEAGRSRNVENEG